MDTTQKTLKSKDPKTLPPKKEVKGGIIIVNSKTDVAGNPIPTEYSRTYSDGALR